MKLEKHQRRVALAFMAHPDDAEILCAGTLVRLTDAGWEVHIATATAGDCGSMTLPAAEIASIRRAEAQAAAGRIQATYHCLEETDGNVFFDRSANRKAIDLFRKIAPTIVFSHPKNDYVLDHEQMHQLARRATFSYPTPNSSSLPLIEGSAIPWLYYCDPIEGADPYTGVRVEPTTYVDITASMDRKIDMLACHESQRSWLKSHHGMDEYIESMKNLGAIRGQESDVSYAEAFVQHIGHAYPQSDVLKELFGRD